MLAGLACYAMAGHVLLDVLLRASVNRPLSGTLEYTAVVWMPCVVFLALAACEARGEHIRVTILRDVSSAAIRRVLDAGAVALTVLVVALLAYFQWIDAIDAVATRESSLGSTTVPVWPAKLLAAAGLTLFFVRCAIPLKRGPDPFLAPGVPSQPDAKDADL